VFSGKKDFTFGRQPELVDGTNTVTFYFLLLILSIYIMTANFILNVSFILSNKFTVYFYSIHKYYKNNSNLVF